MSDEAVLTIGTIQAGNAANVIPDTALLKGSIRTFDEEVRQKIKDRMTDIVSGMAALYRAEGQVIFGSGCPTLKNDPAVAEDIASYAKELLGARGAFTPAELAAMAGPGGNKQSKAGGSEDFAYVSQEIPTVMLALAAGRPQDGYVYPQHHPKVKFDEAVLPSGSALYAYAAMRWLEEHK